MMAWEGDEPTTKKPTPGGAINYRAHAEFLYGLLDDIDTASDIAKSDDAMYRGLVEKYHHRRFEVADCDGYAVTFKENA